MWRLRGCNTRTIDSLDAIATGSKADDIFVDRTFDTLGRIQSERFGNDVEQLLRNTSLEGNGGREPKETCESSNTGDGSGTEGDVDLSVRILPKGECPGGHTSHDYRFQFNTR